MIHAADLPDTIAIFPLPGALLLPRSRLPLHIFEPRYLQMIEDALKTPQRLIGMIQPNPTATDTDALHRIGCAGRIVQFSETDDGRYMIVLSGVSRFRITGEQDGFSPYRCCSADWTGFQRDMNKAAETADFDRPVFLDLLGRYFTAREMSTDLDTMKNAEDEMLINSLSMLLDFSTEDKQALLETPTLTTRRDTLTTLIEFALRGGTDKETLQ